MPKTMKNITYSPYVALCKSCLWIYRIAVGIIYSQASVQPFKDHIKHKPRRCYEKAQSKEFQSIDHYTDKTHKKHTADDICFEQLSTLCVPYCSLLYRVFFSYFQEREGQTYNKG